MATSNASLQISLAPLDLGHVVSILPHQLRVLANQVDEIQFTIDANPAAGTTYGTEDHAKKLFELRRFLEGVITEYPHARIVDVDYSPDVVRAVARAFTGGDFVPNKAWSGSPFYAYLYGIYAANTDYVFHADSDMLFGGGSQKWVSEAIRLLEENENILACYPLGGPPRADGELTRKVATLADRVLIGQTTVASDLQRVAFSYPDMSTRVFLLDRRRFSNGKTSIPLARARWPRMLKTLLFNSSWKLAKKDFKYLLTTLADRRRVIGDSDRFRFIPSVYRDKAKAFLIENSPYLLLEDCISILTIHAGVRFVGFLGTGRGLWSLHPAYRNDRFYSELPSLIERVEAEDVPDDQRGDFDVRDSMLDFSDVRRKTRLDRLLARR